MTLSTTAVAKTVETRAETERTASAIRELASGDLMEVLATDPGSTKDFTAWSKTTGHELVEASIDGKVFRYILRKK